MKSSTVDSQKEPAQPTPSWKRTAWHGKWKPLRIDTIPAVVAEVSEFVEIYQNIRHAVDTGLVPAEGIAPAERRMQQMIKSAELRLEILTHFYDTHKKDPRSEKVKAGVRVLRALMQLEGVEPDTFAPEVGQGPHSHLARERSPSPSKSPGRKGEAAKDDAEEERKPDESQSQAYVEHIKAREEGLRTKLKYCNEREKEQSMRLQALEAENLKLERAMLEMAEGRERMKGLVEEQVYTVSLLTQVTGLLHFQIRRTVIKAVARGIIFWCCSVIFLIHSVVTGGAYIAAALYEIRGAYSSALSLWMTFAVDISFLVLLLGLVNEWCAWASHDLNHGVLHWFTESTIMVKEDALAASRQSMYRFTDHTPAYEPKPRPKHTSQQHVKEAQMRSLGRSTSSLPSPPRSRSGSFASPREH